MPILLTRPNGPRTLFRNVEFLPFYYLIPQRMLDRCDEALRTIPRNPRLIFTNRKMCDIIESDLFLLLIIDATAYMVWPYMGYTEYMEIYSGYDPAWKLAHCPAYWIQEFTDEKIIPTVEFLYQFCNTEIPRVPESRLDAYLRYIVPRVMKKHNMHAAVQTAAEYRCFEDFDYRDSRQKTDFHRKWYHTRTKHPMISLEQFQEQYVESHNGQEWDVADPTQDFEETIISEILVEQFKATLTEKDLAILEMRMKGYTLEKIAEDLGYQNHSGVLKRIRKIGLAYEKFTGVNYGFEDRHITE